MQQFKGAIFDLDGLLIDSERLRMDFFRQSCMVFNLPDLSDVYLKCIGSNLQSTKDILSNTIETKIKYDDFFQHWNEHYKDHWMKNPIDLKPGALDLLKHYQSLNIPMAVATSTRSDIAIEKLETTGLKQFFHFIVGGEQVKNSKPHPDIYLKSAQLLNIQPEDCIAFEDSENGVRSAVRANMTVVQVPDLIKPSEGLLALNPIVLNSLMDVIEYHF